MLFVAKLALKIVYSNVTKRISFSFLKLSLSNIQVETNQAIVGKLYNHSSDKILLVLELSSILPPLLMQPCLKSTHCIQYGVVWQIRMLGREMGIISSYPSLSFPFTIGSPGTCIDP